jgi:hypothetical protein
VRETTSSPLPPFLTASLPGAGIGHYLLFFFLQSFVLGLLLLGDTLGEDLMDDVDLIGHGLSDLIRPRSDTDTIFFFFCPIK